MTIKEKNMENEGMGEKKDYAITKNRAKRKKIVSFVQKFGFKNSAYHSMHNVINHQNQYSIL